MRLQMCASDSNLSNRGVLVDQIFSEFVAKNSETNDTRA